MYTELSNSKEQIHNGWQQLPIIDFIMEVHRREEMAIALVESISGCEQAKGALEYHSAKVDEVRYESI